MKPPPVDFMPLVNELRIRGEVLKNERAEYGEQMVSTLSAQLAVESASGWRSVTRHPDATPPCHQQCLNPPPPCLRCSDSCRAERSMSGYAARTIDLRGTPDGDQRRSALT